MKLKCETILDFYMHENKKILCQIRVPSSKSRKHKNTCRCLTQDQWKTFEKELEKLIIKTTSTDEWGDESLCKFKINPNIEVKVQKSTLSLKNFYKCLGSSIDIGEHSIEESKGDDINEIVFILECLLDFRQNATFISTNETQEYEPQLEPSPNSKIYSPLLYEPYTPSKRKYRADSVDTLKSHSLDFLGYESTEDTYSPKPVLQSLASETASSKTLTKTIPKYKPAPIIESCISRDSYKSNDSEHINEVIVETDEDETVSPEKYRALRSNLKKKAKKEIEYIPKSRDPVVIEAPTYIPTPIEEVTTTTNVIKSNSYKKLKKRSKTIDVFPAILTTNTEKNNSKTLEDSKENICKELKYTEIIAYRSKEKNKDLNENISTTKDKEKKTIEKSKTSSSSGDDILAATSKTSKISKTHLEEIENDFFEKATNVDRNSQESYDNASVLNTSDSIALESAIAETSSSKRSKRARNKYNLSPDFVSLRRSERSPSKPKRLIEEKSELSATHKKSNNQKTSPRNKELFGTDDDGDDSENDKGYNNNNANEIKRKEIQTPINKKIIDYSSSSSSTKKKNLKRDKSNECEQEKRDINKWLSKKKITSDIDAPVSSKATKSSKSSTSKTSKKVKSLKYNEKEEIRPKSATPTALTFDIPSREEIEEIRNKTKLLQRENELVKAELDKLRASPPKEVDNLSLQDMPLNDILDTFLTYKSDLDEIYAKNRKRDHIKGHDGINHCFVIRLLQPNVQMKMLEKLAEVYSNKNSTTQATLFANALLPEWVIRMYMEKFSFTRQQAIQQIKAQDDYRLHMEEQTDGSFVFD